MLNFLGKNVSLMCLFGEDIWCMKVLRGKAIYIKKKKTGHK